MGPKVLDSMQGSVSASWALVLAQLRLSRLSEPLKDIGSEQKVLREENEKPCDSSSIAQMWWSTSPQGHWKRRRIAGQ